MSSTRSRLPEEKAETWLSFAQSTRLVHLEPFTSRCSCIAILLQAPAVHQHPLQHQAISAKESKERESDNQHENRS